MVFVDKTSLLQYKVVITYKGTHNAYSINDLLGGHQQVFHHHLTATHSSPINAIVLTDD